MSTPKKLIGTASGKPETALQQLKAAWLRLSEQAQEYWQAQFSSARTQADLRSEIAKKLSITLPADSTLTKFRAWLSSQEILNQIAAEAEEDRRRFEEMFPSDTAEEIQTKMHIAYQARALARGDAGLGKFMLRQSLQERRFAFAQQQAARANRTDEEKALQFCLEESKKFPAVQELFVAAFAELKKARGK